MKVFLGLTQSGKERKIIRMTYGGNGCINNQIMARKDLTAQIPLG
jgi:hypothetical protein